MCGYSPTVYSVHMSIIENLQWRYATQQFDQSKSIPAADLTTILDAGNLAATAYGLQPFQFVLVETPAIKHALVPHAYGQEHFAQNSALIIIAARTDVDEAYIGEFVTRTETTRNLATGTLDGFKGMMNGDLGSRTPEARLAWAKEQAFIALGTMMAAASELHIDNHAMTGFDASQFNAVLGLDAKHLHATVALALGYRAENDNWQHYAKVRKSIDDMVVRI